MIKYILALVFTIPAMLGLAELLHGIRLRILAPRGNAATYTVVFLKNDCPEQQLLFAAEQLMWHGRAYADRIVAVDLGLSEENLIACKSIAEKKNILLCNPETINAEIFGVDTAKEQYS